MWRYLKIETLNEANGHSGIHSMNQEIPPACTIYIDVYMILYVCRFWDKSVSIDHGTWSRVKVYLYIVCKTINGQRGKVRPCIQYQHPKLERWAKRVMNRSLGNVFINLENLNNLAGPHCELNGIMVCKRNYPNISLISGYRELLPFTIIYHHLAIYLEM